MSQSPPNPSNNESNSKVEAHMQGLASCAQTYVTSTLGRDRSIQGISKLIRKIDVIMDSELDAAHAAIAAKAERGEMPAMDCKAGCSHCCHQIVGASIPEILHLASHILSTFSQEDIAALKERITAHTTAKKATHLPSKNFSMPCPLLVNDLCSVWSARPLVCRAYNSFDVNACIRFFESHKGTTYPYHMFDWAVEGALGTGLDNGLPNVGLDPSRVELVEALGIALNHSDAAERYLAGERVFASADLEQPHLAPKPGCPSLKGHVWQLDHRRLS